MQLESVFLCNVSDIVRTPNSPKYFYSWPRIHPQGFTMVMHNDQKNTAQDTASIAKVANNSHNSPSNVIYLKTEYSDAHKFVIYTI